MVNKILLLSLLYSLLSPLSIWARDPDENISFEKLVSENGFRLETHSITTQDGYILTVHRVVDMEEKYDKIENKYNSILIRKPVIIGHCIYCTSQMYFVNSPMRISRTDWKRKLNQYTNNNNEHCGDNFGFCLASQNRYDVWVPNFRGNKYSLGHFNTNSVTNPDYWKFSFQEKAQYDLPAVIQLVQKVTGQQKVAYIGYSQGTIMMFALLAEQPHYATIIKPFIAWAPGLFMGTGATNMRRISYLLQPLLRQLAGPYFPMSSHFLQTHCRGPILSRICARSFDLLFGPSNSWNYTRWPVYARSTSHGSNWELVHIFQLIQAGRLQKFDYGSKESNLLHYGNVVDLPPRYPIENIPSHTKIVLINGKTDWCMTPDDIDRTVAFLRPRLGSNLIHYEIPSKSWSHLDFVFGQGAGRLVYDKTIEFLDQFID